MNLTNEIVNNHISYFFSKIVGFKNQEIKYISIGDNNNEFLSIAMDKIDRMTRKRGRLRTRIWSNCYFIFHDNNCDPNLIYNQKVNEIKKEYPFLFIRSYVYFIFIRIQEINQLSLLSGHDQYLDTKQFKIWIFNSKYELQEESRRKNIFGISLNSNESIENYVYLANTSSELQRMAATNSDAIDCVRAFTGNLELLEQTSGMLDTIRTDFKSNDKIKIIVEGPARSGKTIIAAILLGEYENSKFLLMNYFFYQAIVDGFHALSGWSKNDIDSLVKNDELEILYKLRNNFPKLLKNINNNIYYAINECERPKKGTPTKKWLIDNISELFDLIRIHELEQNDIPVLNELKNIHNILKSTDDEQPFTKFNKNTLLATHNTLNIINSEKCDTIKNIQNKISSLIDDIIKNSKQKFFHHNINTKKSSKISEGCWITRGNPTKSKMWSETYKPQLIICDEVQRLGLIPKYGRYDEFNEIKEILSNSNQSFFTGDDFQKLNPKYDKGIKIITNMIKSENQSFKKYTLPDSVGIPAEIGFLMKYLTNPQAILDKTDLIKKLISSWKTEREFEITFIENNSNNLIKLFDQDKSNKKHIASPISFDWLNGEKVQINTYHRERPIICISDHSVDGFAYKFPYFCNEEIMPNYILSAYELISREVESLYVHIPYFKGKRKYHEEWYRYHLYVLFTRPTSRLIINIDVKSEYLQIKQLVEILKNSGAKISVSFI